VAPLDTGLRRYDEFMAALSMASPAPVKPGNDKSAKPGNDKYGGR